MTELCIGTAQFDLEYGISNKIGKPSIESIQQILSFAEFNKLRFIDTAPVYGQTERILGELLATSSHFRIITKLSTQSLSPWPLYQSELWESEFQLSLKNLRQNRLYALLLHNPSDLFHPDSPQLISWLRSLLDRNLVEKIGLSIYNSFDLQDLPLDFIQLVQLPFSIFDQRLLLDGTLSLLNSKGISIHARSIFLQGLVFMNNFNRPSFFSEAFQRHHQLWLDQLALNNVSPLSASLSFIRSFNFLEAALVGVENLRQMTEIICNFQGDNHVPYSLYSPDWGWPHEIDIDPRIWPHR